MSAASAEPVFTTAEQLAAKVRTLADLRNRATVVDGVIHQIESAMHASNAELYAEEKKLMEAIKQTELELRAEGLDVFAQTDDQHPCAGIDVDIKKDVEYDRAQADAWSAEHNVARIPSMLDAKAFEKLVKSKTVDLPFAKIVERPTVTIARDLNKALGLTLDA